MSYVAAIMAIAGSVVSAVGSIQQGEAQKAMYNYQAEVAKNNAQIQRQNAAWATEIGDTQAVNQGLKARAEVGQIRANQAGAGLDPNTGSAVDVRSSAEELGELSELTVRSNATRESYGYQVQATGDLAQSQLDVAAGKQAQTAGYIGAVGSLLGGASKGYSMYQGWQSANPSGGGTVVPGGGTQYGGASAAGGGVAGGGKYAGGLDYYSYYNQGGNTGIF